MNFHEKFSLPAADAEISTARTSVSPRFGFVRFVLVPVAVPPVPVRVAVGPVPVHTAVHTSADGPAGPARKAHRLLKKLTAPLTIQAYGIVDHTSLPRR